MDSTTHLVIRQAVDTDVAAIHKFVCELEEQSFDFDLFEVIYKNNIQRPDNIYLVATVNNLAVGYISCHGQMLLHHLGKVYEIQELFVKEEHRGKRIGETLIRALKERLAPEKYASLEVTTNKHRTDTIRFYERCGFDLTHVKFTSPISFDF